MKSRVELDARRLSGRQFGPTRQITCEASPLETTKKGPCIIGSETQSCCLLGFRLESADRKAGRLADCNTANSKRGRSRWVSIRRCWRGGATCWPNAAAAWPFAARSTCQRTNSVCPTPGVKELPVGRVSQSPSVSAASASSGKMTCKPAGLAMLILSSKDSAGRRAYRQPSCSSSRLPEYWRATRTEAVPC